MSRACRIAVIAAALVLSCTTPARTAQQPAPLFDRLLGDYTAGRYDIVDQSIKTPEDLNALQPQLNTALTTWHDGVTRVRAMFLLEIAAVTAARKWAVPPFKGTPPLFHQVGLIWMRSSPPGASARDDAFTMAFNRALVALAERTIVNSPAAIDDFIDVIQARASGSSFATPTLKGGDARLNLARAVAAELVTLRPRSPGMPRVMDDAEVITRFKKAMSAPDALPETFVRAACARLRTASPKEALAILDQFKDPKDDTALTYWAWLFRGRALAALDRPAEADAAYRAALGAAPHAQSASAALASLYLFWNNPAEAQRWSAAITTAPADAVDPWWFYAQGDYRFMPAWLASLREEAR